MIFLSLLFTILILAFIALAIREPERLMQYPYSFDVIDDELIEVPIYYHEAAEAEVVEYTDEDFHRA